MTMAKSVVVGVGVMVGALGISYIPARSSTPDGQVVFAAAAGGEQAPRDQSLGRVDVVECRETAEGLRVRGRVTAMEQEVVPVLVSPGSTLDPGRAVSAGFAASASLVEGAGVGSFLITIPWASEDSEFRVASAASMGTRDVVTGVPSRCPPRGTASPP